MNTGFDVDDDDEVDVRDSFANSAVRLLPLLLLLHVLATNAAKHNIGWMSRRLTADPLNDDDDEKSTHLLGKFLLD